MTSSQFTDRVRKTLHMARGEAARRNHDYVGTEHGLLAMMAEGDGVGAAVLMQLEVDFSVARQAIESKVPNGNRPSASGDLPYDAHARMFELSRVESRNMNHSYIGTEHLLLGIIGEAQAIATLELSNAGVTLEAARREVRMLLGEGFNDAPIGAA